MPQQALDPPQIDPRFQSVRGERVPEQVRVDDLGELRGLPGVAADKGRDPTFPVNTCNERVPELKTQRR